MSLTLLRAADRLATPWKNGGGVTREVAAWPPGAGLDDFDWRVSIAEVRDGGPFSFFPQIDRILAVLEGRLRLTLDGRAPLELSADTAPASFPGDVAVQAEVLEGPVMDLNLMSRPGRTRARLSRHDAGSQTLPALAGPAVVVAAGGPARLWQGESEHHLGLHDALLAEPPGDPLRVETLSGWIYVASFEAA